MKKRPVLGRVHLRLSCSSSFSPRSVGREDEKRGDRPSSWRRTAVRRVLPSVTLHSIPAIMTSVLALQSTHSTAIDRLREENASILLQVAGVIGFALLTALASQIQFRVYLWEVPITLQTAAVYASGLYLGWRNGLLAQLLYLAFGLVLPVFAGNGYGLDYLIGAVSAGYLLTYPLAAAVIGVLSKRWNSFSGSTLAMLLGSAVVFAGGVIWLHYVAGHATWFESIDKGFLRFILIDLVKVVGVGLLYTGTRRLAGTLN